MSKVTTTFEAIDQGLVAHIKEIDKQTEKMAETTDKSSKGIKISFGTIVAAGASLAAGFGAVTGVFNTLTGTFDKFTEALDMGGRLSDLSGRTGETAGNILMLERAFDNTGIGADKVGASINKLQKFMADASVEGSKNMEIIHALGISYGELAGKTPTEQMQMFAEKIANIQDPTERAAAAMQIFGKSGGALLPLFSDFSGEIANARGELGTMIGVMDRNNGSFDAVSDKINVVKGKFTELAAGILDRTIPAIEAITRALARVDAAAIGQRIADIFVGGQEAMSGFSSALDAMNMGDFSTAWDLAMTSAKLQFKLTMNSVHENFIATMGGIKAFLADIFGPGSAVTSLLKNTFFILGDTIEMSIGRALLGVMNMMREIPGIGGTAFDSLYQNASENLSNVERRMSNHQNTMQNSFRDLGGTLSDAGKAFGEGFEASAKTVKPLFDTTADQAKLLAKQAETDIKKADSLMSEFKDNFMNFGKEALMSKPFEPMKKTAEYIDKSIKNTADNVGVIVEKVKELDNIQLMQKKLEEAKLKKGNKALDEQFEMRLFRNQFGAAQKTIEKIAMKQLEELVRIKDGVKDRRNIRDIAKDMGIDTFRKSLKEIMEDILKKRKEIAEEEERKKAEAEAKKKADEKEKKPDEEEDDKQPKEDIMLTTVKMIREILAKIETKLPTHALAL
jgi:hypothetical protein